MRRKNKTLFKDNTKERFSLRKLNIGVCSVILGLAFIGVTTQSVSADTNAGAQQTKQVELRESGISSTSSENDQMRLNQNQEKQENDEKFSDDTEKLIRRVSSQKKFDVGQAKHVFENKQEIKNNIIKAADLQSINKTVNTEDKNEEIQKVKSLNELSARVEINGRNETTYNLSSNKQKAQKESKYDSLLYKEVLKNTWHEDETGQQIYFGSDGKMVRSSVLTDNKGRMYYVDSQGHYGTNNWARDSKGNWYYQSKDGQLVRNDWQKINGASYYFKPDAVMAANERAIDNHGDKYSFDSQGHYQKNSWVSDETGKWAYFGSDGKMVRSSVLTDNKGRMYYVDSQGHYGTNNWARDSKGNWYYQSKDGQLVRNDWQKINGASYYFKPDAVMAANERAIDNHGDKYSFDSQGHYQKNSWVSDETGKWAYFGSDGKMVRSSVLTDNKGRMYYVDSQGHYGTNNWARDSKGNWYYQSKDGQLVRNDWQKINGASYYFKPDAVMAANERAIDNHGDKYSFDSQGHYQKNSWVSDETGKWAYFGSDGKMVRSSVLTDNKGRMYYVDSQGHYGTNNWARDSKGNWYYQSKDGQLVRNDWQKINGASYYFKPDAVMAANERAIDNHGDKYSFDSQGHYQKNSWVSDETGKWAYFGSDGKMVRSSVLTDNKGRMYYVDSQGHYGTNNWARDSKGNWYYQSKDGQLVRNQWKIVNGLSYYFQPTGVMAANGNFKDNNGTIYYFDQNGHHYNVKNGEIRTAYIGIYTEPTEFKHVVGKDEATYKFNNFDIVGKLNFHYDKKSNKNVVDILNSNILTYSSNGSQFSIKLNSNEYEFDNEFGKEIDSNRLDHIKDPAVIFDKKDNSYIFDLTKLPTNMAETAERVGEGFQLYVKRKGTPTLKLRKIHKHTNETLINWFRQGNTADQIDAQYIGTTVLDDYSMGVGDRELNRAAQSQGYKYDSSARYALKDFDVDPNFANIEKTRYFIKTQPGTKYYFKTKTDSTYNQTGSLPVIEGSNNSEAMYDADFHSLDFGKEKDGFGIMRAHLEVPKNVKITDDIIPTIEWTKSTGYISQNPMVAIPKIPYFVNYHYSQGNKDHWYIASFTGNGFNKEYNIADNLKGAFLGKKMYPAYGWDNPVLLPETETNKWAFQHFNFEINDNGKTEQDKWIKNIKFDEDVTNDEFWKVTQSHKFELEPANLNSWDPVKVTLKFVDNNNLIKQVSLDISKDSKNNIVTFLTNSNLPKEFGGLHQHNNAYRMPYYNLISVMDYVPKGYKLASGQSDILFDEILYKNYPKKFIVLPTVKTIKVVKV